MFLPSVNGFHFSNDFPSMPDVVIDLPLIGKIGLGDASNGLCGGFVYLALDYYRAFLPVSNDVTPPDNDSELFHRLLYRLWDSFDLPWGAMRYYRWMSDPNSLIKKTWDEFRILERRISESPITIGMIRHHSLNPLELGNNHQLLVYDFSHKMNGVELYVYDCDYSNRDDITLTLTDDKLIHSEDGEQRGFFCTQYHQREV